jgi:hypothetical protein
MRHYVMPALVEFARVMVFVGVALLLLAGTMGVR